MTEFSKKLLSKFRNKKAISLFKKYPLDGFRVHLKYLEEESDDNKSRVMVTFQLFDSLVEENLSTDEPMWVEEFGESIFRVIGKFLDELMKIFFDSLNEEEDIEEFLLNEEFLNSAEDSFTIACKDFLLTESFRAEFVYLLTSLELNEIKYPSKDDENDLERLYGIMCEKDFGKDE